ncbi:MAG: lipase family protein [Intrasporangium sp.]|uniref:lipase family protein n=1 Tax=Intrasporangium sp. TaxID=1925024 RepID=UPI002647143A|nr:lipase family protein [Intrasporangium sp.]MDN5795714.1 lipase family protein [Intrasporangium sp.]
MRADPWDDPCWAAVLDRERLGTAAPRIPVLLYHADADQLFPPAAALELLRAYRRQQADVSWADVGTSNHVTGAHRAAPKVITWLDSRLTPC